MPPIYYGSAPFALKQGSQALNLYYGSTLISDGATVTPVLSVSRSSGIGPVGVVFDGSATTCSSASVDTFHDLLYFFDFGDAAAENYTYGVLAGKSKRYYAGGPVAAYVYEAAGTYTARMWVYNGSTISDPVSTTITITSEDAAFPGTATIVVSNDADFTGAPAGATQVTTSDFDTMMTANVASNRRILFKRGNTFDASVSSILSSGKKNIHFGAFGSGAKPIVNATASSINIFQGLSNGSNPLNNASDWSFNGIRFTASVGAFGVLAISPNTINEGIDNLTQAGRFLIHKCEFDGIHGPCGFSGPSNVVSATRIDNVNHGTAQSGATGIYSADVNMFVTLDCYIDNAGGAEHVQRSQGGKVQAFISNEYRRPPATKHFLTIRGKAGGSYITDRVNISHCILDGSTTTTACDWQMQIAPNAISAIEPIERVRVDSNIIIAHSRNQVSVIIEASKVRVRGNCFYQPSGAISNAAKCVQIVRASTVGTPAPVDNSISGNTMMFDSGTGFTGIDIASSLVGSTTIKSNIAYAPNSPRSGTTGTDGPKFIIDAGTGTQSANNSTDFQVKNINPLFNGALTTIEGFKLQTGSPYKNAGINIKQFIDPLGFLRKEAGLFDAGAVNSVDKQTDAWSLVTL